jgi:uncharacterized coiled-coil DUF342 family protein
MIKILTSSKECQPTTDYYTKYKRLANECGNHAKKMEQTHAHIPKMRADADIYSQKTQLIAQPISAQTTNYNLQRQVLACL